MSMASAGMDTREAFDRLLGALRPKLHRYCARMTGSVIDGEDVVQDALINSIEAFSTARPIADPESWLFRIARNAALDFLRRRNRQDAIRSDEDMNMIADPSSTAEDRQAAAASLRTFMRLPVGQRSSVILMDVLGYSLEEIGGIHQTSIAAVKANLHRGRTMLRELAQEPEDLPPPALAEPDRALLARYVEHFNARDFEAIRSMLADEVGLDLVNRARMTGRSEVGNYFHNYALSRNWHLAPGLVDRRPAVLVRDPDDPSGRAIYFILLNWADRRIVGIRDFRYARYAMDGAEIRFAG